MSDDVVLVRLPADAVEWLREGCPAEHLGDLERMIDQLSEDLVRLNPLDRFVRRVVGPWEEVEETL